MSVIIQPISATSLNVLGAYTQPGNGGSDTPTFTGPIPALNELVQVHKASDGTLIGYYKVTAIAGNLVQLFRTNALGLTGATSIDAGAIMIYCFKQRFNVPLDYELFSDASTVNPSTWTDVLNPSLDQITTVAQYISLHFWLKHTTVVDGNYRILMDGAGYSNETRIQAPLIVGVDGSIGGCTNTYINAGSGTLSIHLQVQTAAGTVTPKGGTNMIVDSSLDI